MHLREVRKFTIHYTTYVKYTFFLVLTTPLLNIFIYDCRYVINLQNKHTNYNIIIRLTAWD